MNPLSRALCLPILPSRHISIGIAFLLLVLILLNANRASAALIDIAGENYSYDTATGMDWLDLTESSGLSWGYIDTQFGSGAQFEGWRYATGIEFEAMVTGMGGTAPYTGWSTANDGVAVPILDQLGALIDTGTVYGSYGILADPYGASHRRAARVQNNTGAFYETLGDYIVTHDGLIAIGDSGSHIGSFLVRTSAADPVPEPATMLLLGSGLIGMAGIGRKRFRK